MDLDRTWAGTLDRRALRVGLTGGALAIGVLTYLVDPGPPAYVAWLGLAVAVLVGWAWWPRLPLPLFAAGVLVPLVFATRDGQLEQGLFLASVLALVVATLEEPVWRAALVGVAAVATPVVAWLLLPPSENFGVLSWVLGIAFPWALGRLLRRQVELLARLAEARRALALQAVAEERRRIARDVHDLVGHGLATVLLHITGARHVLRRDPDSADEALATAEAVGRRSMAELRSTMALLRRSGESGTDAPVPGLAELPALVAEAAERGLRVRLVGTVDDLDGVTPGVALAAHRIVAEALANALRHAPAADHVVTVTAGDQLVVEVTTAGPIAPARDTDRPRYGLVGMHERAEIAGGKVVAGATATGWRVRAELPLRDAS